MSLDFGMFEKRRWGSIVESLKYLVISLWFVACWRPAIGATEEDAKPKCATWSVGQHDKTIEEQLACLKEQSSSGKLKYTKTSLLYSEISYYYTNVANTGNVASAEIIKILVDERERRQPPKRWSSVPYSAFLLSGQIKNAVAERAEKRLDVAEFDAASIISALPARPNEATYWSFVGKSNSLHRIAVDLTQGSHVVVYSSPGCGICHALAEDLLREARWTTVFSRSAIWIEVADGNFDRENYELWKSKFPQFPIYAIFDRKNWPERPLPATPYIYFIKYGKVEDQMLGWTAENKQRLDSTLVTLGFMPSNP